VAGQNKVLLADGKTPAPGLKTIHFGSPNEYAFEYLMSGGENSLHVVMGLEKPDGRGQLQLTLFCIALQVEIGVHAARGLRTVGLHLHRQPAAHRGRVGIGRALRRSGTAGQRVSLRMNNVKLGNDAIVEVTETGSSLRANRLRIIETLMESETQLIANKSSYKDDWKRAKINNISLMLNAAIAAQGRVGLMLNARKADLQKVIGVLPALNSPTVSQLSDAEWVALNTILDETEVREVIPKLKAVGATGIVEYPLSKVVL